MSSVDDLKAMAYGMLRERGMEWFWPALDYIVTRESGWSPTAHNTRGEDSVGLAQMNRAGGMGSGYSVEQLMDPKFNLNLMLNHVENAVNGGASLQAALQPWSTTHGIDAASLVSGQTPQGGGTMATPTQTKPQDIVKWIADNFYGGDMEQAQYYFSQNPSSWLKTYQDFVGASDTTMTPAEAGSLAVRQGELAVSQQRLGFDIEDALRQAELDEKQFGLTVAAQNFANKINAAQEGRSATEFAQEYERAFAAPGQTTVPFTGAESPGAKYAKIAGIQDFTAGAPVPLQPATMPRSPQDALSMFTPQAPQYAPPAPTPPSAPVPTGYAPPPVMNEPTVTPPVATSPDMIPWTNWQAWVERMRQAMANATGSTEFISVLGANPIPVPMR